MTLNYFKIYIYIFKNKNCQTYKTMETEGKSTSNLVMRRILTFALILAEME